MTTIKSASRSIATPEVAPARSAQNWSSGESTFTTAGGGAAVKVLDWPREETARSETVLVVDDEPLMREFLADILRHSGYEVLEASGAREAQELTRRSGHITLLLTDFSMPGINGLELARWFQSKYPDTKVLIATGALWELANLIGEKERMAILPKPFDVGQLSRMLRLVLA